MSSYLRKLIPFFCLALIQTLGCAHIDRANEVTFYFSPDEVSEPEKVSGILRTVAELNSRSRTFKKSPAMLKEAYAELKIRRLNDIPQSEYGKFRKFVRDDDGRAYIIIHPAYYPFFSKPMELSSRSDGEKLPSDNIVERFCSRPSFYDFGMIVMQQQEKILKDFIELMAAEKRLVILILPFDYGRHFSYGYINGLDEYIRYLNEISGGSESVVYMESLDFDTGYLGEENLNLLSDFLGATGAGTLLVGGEFGGRCVDNFSLSLLRKAEKNNIFLVPEITVITAEDVERVWGKEFLNRNWRINYGEVSSKLDSLGAPARSAVRPRQIRHLYIYELSDNGFKLIN